MAMLLVPLTQANDEFLASHHKRGAVVCHHTDDALFCYMPGVGSNVAGQHALCDGKSDGHQSRQRDLFGFRTLCTPMQCPSKDLDYVYTFETEPNYLKFFAGKSKACFVAVPTQEFLQQYKAEGRGVTEYELNLTPHEKQELWRALDEDMEEGPTRRFTMLKSNCVSMSLFMVEQVLEKRYIDFSPNNWLLRMGNARVLHSCLRHSPWADFIFFTFLGSEADKCWTVEELLSPATVGPCLQSDHIVSTEGHQRWTVICGKPHLLSKTRPMIARSWCTPNVFALLLLLLIVGISICGHMCHQNRLLFVTDAFFFLLQPLIGCAML